MATSSYLPFKPNKVCTILLLTLLLMASCVGAITPGSGEPVWLGDPVITTGLDQNNKPIDNVEAVEEGVTKVYCYLSIDGPEGFKIYVRWYHDDQLVVEQFIDFGVERQAAPLLNYQNGAALPTGEYRCEFGLLPDQPLRTVTFHIR